MSKFWRSLTVNAKGLLTRMPDALLNRLPVLGRVHVRTHDGHGFYMRSHGKAGKDRIALKVWRRGLEGYEPETLHVFQTLLATTRLFVDVGANTGLFSLLAALDRDRKVIAFEPVPAIFQLLRANAHLNGMTNLVPEQLAVSDEKGDVCFYVTHTDGGIPTDSSSVAGFRANTVQSVVPGVTLDGYLETRHLGPVDLLKIDVEAAEPRVLRGARQTIRRDRPIILCEVLECVDRDAIHAVMDPFQYEYFHVTPPGLIPHDRLHGNPGRGDRNYLFIPRERAEEVCYRCNSFKAVA